MAKKIKEKPYCDPFLEQGYDLGKRVEREKWQKAYAEAIRDMDIDMEKVRNASRKATPWNSGVFAGYERAKEFLKKRMGEPDSVAKGRTSGNGAVREDSENSAIPRADQPEQNQGKPAEPIRTHKPIGKKDSRRVPNPTGHPTAKVVESDKYNSRGNLGAKGGKKEGGITNLVMISRF